MELKARGQDHENLTLILTRPVIKKVQKNEKDVRQVTKERRKYSRDVVGKDENAPEVRIDGTLVQMVNFSAGGLFIRSKTPLEQKQVNIMIRSQNGDKIDLTGRVVRVTQEGRLWNVALDLTRQYHSK